MTKASELRKMSVDELRKTLSEVRLNLFKERASIITKGGSKNTQAIRQMRVEVARIETLLAEKGRAGNK
ncbi:MAG: 50S ribosomal protein L29 [Candidatus Marsarchaeota archaeon]|nr:50S ribosomal protein L29 [Candidatus Marsarchaeota archaeon]